MLEISMDSKLKKISFSFSMGYRTNLSNDQVLIAYDLNFFLKKAMIKFYFSFNFIKEKPLLMLK
tara:strand:+ start:298 stop:489 length:192 start_codon:yes stop_codon:yes gene_type:complete